MTENTNMAENANMEGNTGATEKISTTENAGAAESSGVLLTLFPNMDQEHIPPVEVRQVGTIPAPVSQADLPLDQFTPEEQTQIEAFAQKIDLSNTDQILMYGAGAQQKVAEFSDSALAQVRTKDAGAAGEMLTGLVVQLKNMEGAGESRGIMKLFHTAKRQFEQMTAQFEKVSANVDNIAHMLEEQQLVLMKDIATLDRLYDMNKAYFKELSMYIAAGEQKLKDALENDLPKLVERAKETGDLMDAQQANDMKEMLNRFEKKLHDLKLTRNISQQMAPQIRLIQNNDSMLVDKINSSLVNTIPLWKNQMVIALGLHHAQQAVTAQRQVADYTNQMLKQNADALQQSTVETAKESERGIVDIETLRYTNESMIKTMDEVMRIQTEGRQKRLEAERELIEIERQLKQKLLEMRG